MKFKVEVDLNDFYSEEEGETFSQAVKDYIATQVKTKVLEGFKATIYEEFTNAVKAKVEVEKNELVVVYLNELTATEKIKNGRSGEITIQEYIKEKLEDYTLKNSNFDNMVVKMVKELGNEIGKELKDRYDMLFASQIVMKLNEQGMLKEDVAKVLLAKKDTEEKDIA